MTAASAGRVRVPWGRAVERVVAVVDGQAVSVATASAARIEPHVNIAGEPRDTLVFEGAHRRMCDRPGATFTNAAR